VGWSGGPPPRPQAEGADGGAGDRRPTTMTLDVRDVLGVAVSLLVVVVAPRSKTRILTRPLRGLEKATRREFRNPRQAAGPPARITTVEEVIIRRPLCTSRVTYRSGSREGLG
jgi:hypothetical protein